MFDDFGWIPGNDTVVWDIFYYYTSSPNNHIVSNFNTSYHTRMASNGYIVSDNRPLSIFLS